jgi:hypothetical protein
MRRDRIRTIAIDQQVEAWIGEWFMGMISSFEGPPGLKPVSSGQLEAAPVEISLAAATNRVGA